MGVGRRDEGLYTRNGVLGTGVTLGPCRSSRELSLIAAATASAADPGDRREGLPDCGVLGEGCSPRNGDDDGDSDESRPNCRLMCKMLCKVSMARREGEGSGCESRGDVVRF
jgi:hypothetical protein